MKRLSFLLILAACISTMSISCASRKGSSSLKGSTSKQTTTSQTPKIKSEEERRAADAEAKLKAQREAEAAAQRERAQAEAKIAKEKAEKEAAEAAKIAAEKAKQAAAEITVKEEAVKIIETSNKNNNGRYHIIIGSFKVLENARALCNETIKEGFLPSIMENDEGMYRVAIFTSNVESTARKEIAVIRKERPQYIGTWLLIEKR